MQALAMSSQHMRQQCMTYGGNLHLSRTFFWDFTYEIEQPILSPQGNVMPCRDILTTCTRKYGQVKQD